MLKKAYLEITNLCNLSCAFCPGTRRRPGLLTPEDFSLLAGRLRPHTEYLYLHLMGEPLAHPQLEEILRRAGALDFRVMITTNGTLLEERGRLLLTSPVVERVSISLHSFEGNEGDGLADYLDRCLRFVCSASAGGKRCALRLWNLDGAGTRGANRQNGAILSTLKGAFPGPWKEGRRGTTLAPGVFLEWGEVFDWPDLSAPEGDGPPSATACGIRWGCSGMERLYLAAWITRGMSRWAACMSSLWRKF